MISLKNHNSHAKGDSLPYRATLEALFMLNYCLREFPLPTVACRFELWCQSKAADAILRNIV